MTIPFPDSLLKLPQEVIQIIFTYIPEECLYTYIDNPVIGEYSADVLLTKVIIGSGQTWSLENAGQKLRIPIGDEFFVHNV